MPFLSFTSSPVFAFNMQRNRVRPDPVSCKSCRSKKLKCSRVQPCANCTSRGISCSFFIPPRSQPDTAAPIQSNVDVLRRLERLESLVLQRTDSIETDNQSDSHATRQQPLHLSSESVVSNVHQNGDQDSRFLENIGIREDSLLHRLSNGLAFRISGMHEMLDNRSYIQHPPPSTHDDRPNEIIVTFPVYRVASLLCESYESNVDHLCRILHKPTVRSLITTFYIRINESEPILPSEAALLLSIFAIAAYFYSYFDGSEIVTTRQDAIHLSKTLSKGALDVLDYTRRNTSGTLEDVQATIIMSFVTWHLDGFSARGRLLSTAAMSIARELRLHRLDAAEESSAFERETSVTFLINREVKRRVFWHIASTDWLLSAISGPQEGMYFINPNHVNVKLPRDCTDSDIVLSQGDEPISGPQPTGMTFFLERLRLAHLCREMTDTVPLETSRLMQMPYDDIIALDGKLQAFILRLPFFFKLDPESRSKSIILEATYPKIPIERYCITTEVHTRRCKLHQRFLHRQSIDLRYAYSRRACLESARAVINVYGDLRQSDSLSTAPDLMGMAIHTTHLALVVMVMDLCFNKTEVDESEMKAEVKAALQMFEDSRNASPLLNRLLSSLSEVLRKHKVELPTTSTLEINNAAGSSNGVALDAFDNPSDEDAMQSMAATQRGLDGMQDAEFALDTPFDEFWQIALQGEPHPDSVSWDNLFSSLDSRPF